VGGVKMRYWKLKEGTLAEGTKLEYYCYKLQELKDHKDELSDKYYCDKISDFLDRIKKEMGV
jgi:hypothetical protein